MTFPRSASSISPGPAWPASVGTAFSGVPRVPLQPLLGEHLTEGDDQPLVIFDDGQVLTCRECLEGAERLADGLSGSINNGDLVAIAIGNRAEFLIAYFAVLARNATAVMISPKIGMSEAEYILQDLHITLAIAEEAPGNVLDAAAKGTLPILRLNTNAPEPLALAHAYGDNASPLSQVSANSRDAINISYSSGTTGMPKAMAFDHEEVLRYVDIFLRTFPFGPHDRMLCPVNFHYGDPIWLLLGSLLNHTPLIMMRHFSVSRFWGVAREFGVTKIMTIGSIPSLLLSATPSSAERNHRVDLALAVAIPSAQHTELIERFGCQWVDYYGMSESGPAIGMPVEFAAQYEATGALGIPFPEMEARLVSESGEVLTGEAIGELELRSPFIPFHGYIGNPAATADMMHDDWLCTGDLMRRDSQGVYYFQSRRKEIIRRSGENIAPAEVESVLRTHTSVVEAAVVAVKDPFRDEEVKAYVQIAESVTPSELADHCRRLLAPHKVPRYFELQTEPFPRTPSQRIRKADLMVDGVHTTTHAWDRDNPEGGDSGAR